MSELLISTEHFGFVLSIFVFLLAVEIKAKFKSSSTRFRNTQSDRCRSR